MRSLQHLATRDVAPTFAMTAPPSCAFVAGVVSKRIAIVTEKER